MPQSKILLDSNCYFRLAKDIHPLLFSPFGNENYTLYVLPDLDKEYSRQRRLQNKFPRVDDPEYQSNRTKKLVLSKQDKANIDSTFDFMWDHVTTSLPGPSRIDVRVLSVAYVLEIPAVTDDNDMTELAKVFEVKVLNSLGLLKLMLDCQHISLSKVRSVVAHWSYVGDKPKNFVKDFRRLFNEEPPP